MTDTILSKQERLQRLRDKKKNDDEAKKRKKDALGIGAGSSADAGITSSISNDFINRILQGEDPFAVREET